jgi:predicted RND superfamily exporter protein
MCAVAFLSFRTLRGVVLPLATVGISVLWTIAFAALTIGSLSVVTIAAPAILTVVGFAYAIHVLSAYNDVLRGEHGDWADREEAVYLALRHVAVPLFFTGVTTAAGFFSLTISPIEAIDAFAIFGGFGVLATLVVSMTFAPAALRLLPVPKRTRSGGDALDRLFGRLADFDIRNRRAILAVGGVGALVSLAGMTRIEVGTATIGNFRRDNPVRLDFELINEHLQGANAFSILFETTVPEAFKEPLNLEAVAQIEAWLAEQPEVGGTTSLVDFVKTLHQGFFDNDPAAFRIPDSRALVSQLLLLGANEELDEFVDTGFQSARVVVRTSATHSRDVVRLVDRIEDQLHLVPHHLRTSVTGDTVLLSRTMDEVALGQALSIGTALLIIYAILCALFTSLRAGLLALLPNVLPVLIYFGLLGWGGISLNLTTGLVACMVMGIAVDDTIHLLVHFNAESKRHADERRGMVEALRLVGRPVTYTTLALCVGFACLVASETRNQIEFGVLSSVTLAFAWLVDVTFTPALASGMRVVSLWDVLTLDLGREPEHSIPLFRGLRATQARVVALLCGLSELPQGEKLFRSGEQGNDMYVVIDGELRASVTQDGRHVALRNLGRGDVIGEVGLFRGARTADVIAVSDARLLRLTRESLTRLERRHPRIGARIYANLGEVLAERLASVTTRVR